MSVTTLSREKHGAPVVRPAGRELELKFLVSEPAFKASQTWPVLAPAGARRAVRMRSFYYDTPGGALHRRRMTLRMRAARRGFLMTLKYDGAFPGGPFERGQIEVFCQGAMPEPALLGAEFAAAVAEAAGGDALVLAYETDIRRITHRIAGPDGDVELAFDAGFIIAGAAKMPVREIELELKAGAPAALFGLGIELAKSFPVRLGTLAKSERGFLLLTQTAPEVVRAGRALAGAPSLDEAIFALVSDCVRQFVGNFAAFESGDALNAIHQMRVALRRLRALLEFFGRAFPCPEFAGFRQQAKHFANAMNEARNLDVFMTLLRDGPAEMFAEEAGLARILAECMVFRQAAYERIRTLLAAPETTSFVLSLQGFLALRAWRNAAAPEALAQLTSPARGFAAAQMASMHRKILKAGGKRLKLSAHERHELRIRIKKLRYLTEGFSAVFEARKQVRAYTEAAAGLQDALGGFNDLVMAREIVESLAERDRRAAGIVLGWCARAAADDGGLVETWRQFRRGETPFC